MDKDVEKLEGLSSEEAADKIYQKLKELGK